jgi:pyridoxal phosphate enzyme (YggS family)
MSTITQRLQHVRERIVMAERQFQRPPGSVQLLAVSKTRPVADLREVIAAGQTLLGESYLQEAIEKIRALAALPVQWHFIGPIQSNKTREIAARFAWVHSVDRIKVARRLSEQRPQDLPPLNVCLQVNVSGESSKSGISLAELPALAAQIAELPGLALRGLMTIPAPSTSLEQQRRGFRPLRLALEALKRGTGLPLDTLSMGMSADLEAAIAEGATLVRVGTDIFGPRLPR